MRSARWRASGSTPPTAPWTPSPPPTWWRAPAASKAATWSSAAMTSRSGAAPPTPASTRSRSMPNAWPMSCGCRWCGRSTAPAAEALDLCRRFLGYLPANVWQLPPVCAFEGPGAPVEELREIVPRSRRQPYDVRRILGLVFDAGSVFEIAPGYGRSCVIALARLGGRPVAVLASDPKVYGGGLTAAAADKMARWVDTADTFHLPVVNIVDQPGFVIGVEAEQAGTIRRGARALAAAYQATVPWVS